MIGFEDPKIGESSIVHKEFTGRKLGDVIDIICNGGTKKELKVKALLEMEHSRLITVTLTEWPNAQNFRGCQNLELEALRDAETDEVREVCGLISVYVKMKDVKCSWYK